MMISFCSYDNNILWCGYGGAHVVAITRPRTPPAWGGRVLWRKPTRSPNRLAVAGRSSS